MREIFKLFDLLSIREKYNLFFLQLLVIISAFTEAASIIIVGPFLEYVSKDIDSSSNNLIIKFLNFLNLNQDIELLNLSMVLIAILFISTLISILSLWRLSLYAQKLGAKISSNLFKTYIFQKLEFHNQNNSSSLVSNISLECIRFTDSVLVPLLVIASKIALVVFILSLILVLNLELGAAILVFFITFYSAIYLIMIKILAKNGKVISHSQERRIRLMNEGFGGIRELILTNKRTAFNDDFLYQSSIFAKAKGLNLALSQIPKFLVEFVAISFVFFAITIQIAVYDEPLVGLLPIATVLTLAIFKLLPAFQQIYFSLANIRGNINSIYSVRHGLDLGLIESYHLEQFKADTINIELQGISYNFPEKENHVLKDISLKIPPGKTIGIIGSSGSGKSTLIDIISGFIEPVKGNVLINTKNLKLINKADFYNHLGFVSQTVFLLDSSIERNIAFAESENEIDHAKLNAAIKHAQLDKLISELDQGVKTIVGEKGVQLSGGQRQRIGIARALYNDPPLLIFDEATSALDNVTENLLTNSLDKFSSNKTVIIVAHRFSTIKKCDDIYMLKDGEIIDKGNFEEISERNNVFFGEYFEND